MVSIRSRIFLLAACYLLWHKPAGAQSSPATEAEALRLFNGYKATIEASNNAVVDEPRILTGDLNSDGRVDAVVFFVMTPADGGNAVVGREAAVYLSTANGLKVAGAFPSVPECWAPDAIRGGIVYATGYECAPPYVKATSKVRFRWNGKKMVKM